VQDQLTPVDISDEADAVWNFIHYHEAVSARPRLLPVILHQHGNRLSLEAVARASVLSFRCLSFVKSFDEIVAFGTSVVEVGDVKGMHFYLPQRLRGNSLEQPTLFVSSELPGMEGGSTVR